MRRVFLRFVFVGVLVTSAVDVWSQEAAPKPGDADQLKAMVIKLQQAVLERDKEIGRLRTAVAELQLDALSAAIKGADPAVQAALGIKPETPPAVAETTKKPPLK